MSVEFILYGGGGNDTYLFRGTDDQDTILDTSGGNDVIKTTDSSLLDVMSFSVLNTHNLRISFSSTEYVTITGQLDTTTSNQIERLELRDGFWLNLASYNQWMVGTGSGQTLSGDTGGVITNDTILGRGGSDTIRGYDGNDHISGDAGGDTLYGGNGNDYLNGGSSADNLYGDANDDHLFGDSGDDQIRGGSGNDYISGGAGADTLYGETGLDIFVFEAPNISSSDTVLDWESGDSIKLVDILIGYDPLQSAINDFVNFTVNGSNSILSVDKDGQGNSYNSQTIATFTDVTGLDAETLLNNGNFIV